MVRVLAGFWVLMMAACVPGGPEPVVAQGGQVSYAIECVGEEQDCYPQAQELCPNGYAITSRKSRVTAIWQGSDVASKLKHSLTIECTEK